MQKVMPDLLKHLRSMPLKNFIIWIHSLIIIHVLGFDMYYILISCLQCFAGASED